MIDWHSTHYKLVMQNPNISYKSLAKLIGVSLNSVVNLSKRLGVKHFKKPLNTGVRNVFFCPSQVLYRVSFSHKTIGSSYNLLFAIGIADAYSQALSKGYINE